MNVLVYAGAAILLLVISRWQNNYRISKTSALIGGGAAIAVLPVTIPLFTFLAIVALSILKLIMAAIALAAFAISKWKFIVALKVKIILLSITGVLLTPWTAGLVWAVIIFIVMVNLYYVAVDWSFKVYAIISRALTMVLTKLRVFGNFFRLHFGPLGVLLAAAIEVPVVTYFPYTGIIEVIGWFEVRPTSIESIIKHSIILTYCGYVYVSFIRDTNDLSAATCQYDMPDLIASDADGAL